MDYQRNVIFKMPEDMDLMPVARTSEKDLDREKLKGYLDVVFEKYGGVFLEENDLLAKLGITRNFDGIDRLTVAGLLIFGEHPQLYLPQIHVKIVSGSGKDMTIDTVHGTLPEMRNITMEAIRKRVDKRDTVGYLSGKHVETPAYPLKAIEEAVSNAIVHRDYGPYALGKYIKVEISDKYMEIKSPGAMPGVGINEEVPGLNVHSRNSTIVRILEDMGEIKNAGTGIHNMLAAFKEARLEPPVFENEGEDFVVRFGNREILGFEEIRRLEEMNLQMDEDAMAAVSYAMKNGSINNREYQHLNDVNRDEAFRDLKLLVDREVLIQEGAGSGTYYVLNEKIKGNKEHKEQLSFFGEQF